MLLKAIAVPILIRRVIYARPYAATSGMDSAPVSDIATMLQASIFMRQRAASLINLHRLQTPRRLALVVAHRNQPRANREQLDVRNRVSSRNDCCTHCCFSCLHRQRRKGRRHLGNECCRQDTSPHMQPVFDSRTNSTLILG
jgi:hypothetical protein